MNKTFNDPNVKYSDQGTPLAQAAEAFSTIGEVTEAVDDLEEAVGELSEKVDLIPVPAAANAGQVLKVNDSGAYTLVNDNIFKTQISGGESKVFTITPTFRAMVVGFGAHGAQRGAYLHIITDSALSTTTVTAASDYTFTFDSTTKKLTVANGYSGSGAYLMWIIYSGAISEDPAPETAEA